MEFKASSLPPPSPLLPLLPCLPSYSSNLVIESLVDLPSSAPQNFCWGCVILHIHPLTTDNDRAVITSARKTFLDPLPAMTEYSNL